MINCIVVGVGGFIGSVCRYLIGLLPIEAGSGFPIKTLAINVVGSFCLGLIAALAAKNEGMDPHVVLLLKVGVCGGFTTFSTFAYESTELIRSGHTLTAFAHICLSVLLGVVAVFAAQLCVKG